MTLHKVLTVAGLSILMAFKAYGQEECPKIVFEYDNAGNRIKRYYQTECIDDNPIDQKSFIIALDPNPANTYFNISVSEEMKRNEGLTEVPLSDEGIVEVIDIYGKVLIKKNIKGKESSLDVSALACGSYICRMIYDDRSAVKRFIIVR